MGEAAEAILNGDFDEITGEYIGEGQGFPRTLTGKRNPKNGVKQWLRSKSEKLNETPVGTIIKQYGTTVLGFGSRISNDEICIIISLEFTKFCNWVMLNYTKK